MDSLWLTIIQVAVPIMAACIGWLFCQIISLNKDVATLKAELAANKDALSRLEDWMKRIEYKLDRLLEKK